VAQEWREIVEHLGSQWFPRESRDLLETYCEVKIDLVDVNAKLRTFKHGNDFPRGPDFDRLLRWRGQLATQLAALATKLRFSQQSRSNPASAGTEARRRATRPAINPWEDDALDVPQKRQSKPAAAPTNGEGSDWWTK
jgi:hypothetical protein